MTEEPLDKLFDDELEKLTSTARLLFGEDAVIAATDRASATLGAGVTSDEDVSKLRDALKAELRRLITPH